MVNLFNIAILFFSSLFVLFLIILTIEILTRIIFFLKEKIFYQNIQRKDFINKEYHDYLNWIENLDKPMFEYLPIGIRLFNRDNYLLENCVKNNSIGFRTYEFAQKKKDELRIILIGGSTAWGSGSSSNETNISGYLEQMINDNKKLLGTKTHAKVFNLSQVLSTITQDILSLTFYASELEPDIAISFCGWNEAITNYKLDEKKLNKHKFFYMTDMENWEPTHLPKTRRKILKNLLGRWFIDNLKILSVFLNKGRNFDITDKVSKNLKQNSEVTVNNFNILEKISKGFNFKVIHFLQPNLYRKSYPTESELKVLELYNDHRPIHGGKKFGKFLENTNIYEFICNESTKKSLNVVSLLDIFKKEKRSVFYTLVHLNDLGYKLIAEEIYKNLLVKQK
jgi:hypothetical protein